MPEPHLLVIAVDGLRASALGAYGNTSYDTPAIDRLAAEGFLADWCFADSPELASVYRSLWQSTHVLRPESHVESRLSLPLWLGQQGYATTLVTDEPRLAAHPDADQFDECVELPLWPVSRPSHEPDRRSPDDLCGVGRPAHNEVGRPAHNEVGRPAHNKPGAASDRAEDISQTALARLMAAACECIAQPVVSPDDDRDRPQLVWAHARGMYGRWDAPLELQEPLRDEGDPEPYDDVEPPDVVLGKDSDPDTVFRYACAYAAQVMVLDACIDGLMAAADATWPDGNWLLMLVGTRGFPLGEHGRVGGVDDRLFADMLHVPWLIRFPAGAGRLVRTRGLASHVDLLPTLIDWLAGTPPAAGVDGLSILPLLRTPRPDWRDAVISAGPTGARAIRTADWCLQCLRPEDDRSRPPHEPPTASLYVRPDDRWEANDVAKLCPDEVTDLAQAISDVSAQIASGQPVPSRVQPDRRPAPAD